jgi:hypothetical protein
MNTTSLLPERGIFVPVTMIFHPQLPASVLVSWIQLRCLAWHGWHTPPLSLPELAAITGIHPDRLQRHLVQLQGISALSLQASGNGKVIICFPEHPGISPECDVEAQAQSNAAIDNSASSEVTEPPSYFPRRILGYISYQEEQEENPDTGKFGPADPVSMSSETCLSEYLLFRY